MSGPSPFVFYSESEGAGCDGQFLFDFCPEIRQDLKHGLEMGTCHDWENSNTQDILYLQDRVTHTNINKNTCIHQSAEVLNQCTGDIQ